MAKKPSMVAPLRAALLLCAGVIACGDGGTEPGVPAGARIEVDLTSDRLAFGDGANATATVYDGEGAALSGVAVSWSTSDAAVVQVAADGQLTATGVGSAVVTASAGNLSEGRDVTVVPRAISATTPDGSVALYESLAVELGPDAPPLGAAPVPGVIAGDTIWFSATDDPELRAVVVGVATGGHVLVIQVDRNHTAELAVTIEPAPQVVDPGVVLDDLQATIDAHVAGFDSVALDIDTVLPGTDFARAVAAEFRAWSDTASAESRLAVAQFLVATDALEPEASFPALQPFGAPQAVEGCVGSFSATGLERRFAQCVVVFGGALHAISLGARALPVCNYPATPANMALCLSALASVAGGAILAWNAADRALDLPAMIVDERIEVVATWFDDGSSSARRTSANRALRAAAAEMDLVSGTRYALGTHATYRSVIEADRLEGGDAGTLVDLLETFHEGWMAFQTLVDRLPDALRTPLPALAESPGAASDQPRAVEDAEVAAEYLTAANPSPDTRVDFDPADRSFVVTLERGLERDFTFDLVYASPVDQFTMPVAGSIRIDAAIDADGGQSQTGEAGVELAQPLVVRVTDAATGTGLPGVTVGWVVVAGEGSVSDESTVTDADGRASVRWTLGDSEEEQVVYASARYASGEIVGGAAVAFDALTSWPYTLQLMSYDPNYANMSPVATLTRGQTFTAPNGLSQHFRLLRDGQPVGDPDLAGVEAHYFGDPAYPMNSATDGHVPEYTVMMYDAVANRDIAFPLDVTLSNAGYRAVVGRTIDFYLASDPSFVRHLTLNPDGTTRLVLGDDAGSATTGSWTMSEGGATWWNNCSGEIVSRPSTGAVYVPGNYPTNYIIIMADGTLGFNSIHSCPNLPDYMRWVIE